VYRDARKRGKGVLMSLLWCLANLVLLVVFFPLWLFCRPEEYITPTQEPRKPESCKFSDTREITETENMVLCIGCGNQLRKIQIENMLGNPKFNEWCREGFCSLDCFEKHRDN
jgi:hypothetical protein